MLTLENLSLQRGGETLIESASLKLNPRERVALIGNNGCGKSSLFSLILGQLSADGGNFHTIGNCRIAHMDQETPAIERSALDYVLDGDQQLRELQAQLEEAEQSDNGMRVAQIHQELDNIHGYTADVRGRQLLEGLGFATALHERPVNSFSGGWRIRLNLAQALMCPSDLLLLDEPTNHLDLDAILWLENWLKRYTGTLVFISHDRDFIDRLATHVIHFEHKQLNLYTGNYSQFEKARAERLAQQQALYEKQQQRISEIHNFVRRFGAKATKAKQAQSRLKELERMDEIAAAHIDSQFTFTIPCSDKISSPLLVMRDADLGYDGQAVVKNISLTLLPEMRIAILGANGQGKSTLIKALAGELNPISGERTCGQHLSIGYFAQHQLEALDNQATAFEHIQRMDLRASEQSVRKFLGSFGFSGSDADTTVDQFSGGERARLALAQIAWKKPNLLLLDEPTNHLDLEMRHALNMALQSYPGTVVVVSHDRHLLRTLADQFIWVHDGEAAPYDDSLEAYEDALLKRLRESNTRDRNEDIEPGNVEAGNVEAGTADIGESADARKQRKRDAAALRQKMSPIKNKINKLEQEIDSLQRSLKEIENLLADTQLYESESKARLQEVLGEQAKTKSSLENKELEWLSLQEELEILEEQS